MTNPLPRIQAILDELDRVAQEYINRRGELERAKVQFESAKDKFTPVRRLASNMMTSLDLVQWEQKWPGVQFAGLSISEAIEAFLRQVAWQSAWFHVNEGHPWEPARNLEQITSALDQGGFEFKSTAPQREANAALINLSSVSKLPDGQGYLSSDAHQAVEINKQMRLQQEQEGRARLPG